MLDTNEIVPSPLLSGPMPSERAVGEIPHRAPDEAQLILVTGMRGFGKTYWLQHWTEEAEPRILILDFHEDFPQVRRRIRYQDALADLANDDGPCRRRVVPSVGDGGNCRDFAVEFFRAAERSLRNCLLVVDELSLYCPTENLRATDNKALETLILQGRRYGVRMAVACQRLNRIPGEFHSEATEILVFRTRRPRDLKVLEDWGFDDAYEVAPSLRKGECVILWG